MILDQTTDRYHVILKSLYDANVLPEFTKRASLDVPRLPVDGYADPGNRLFPVHTPEHTLVSAAYFFKQAGHQAPGGKQVLEKLTSAAYLHEVESLLLKLASDITSLETSPPEDHEGNYHLLLKQGGKTYGKFFANTPALVKKAEEHFLQHHHKYPVDWKLELCGNLYKTASALKMELHPLLKAYAKQNVCFSKKASEEIAKRGYYTKDQEMATLYMRLAQVTPGSMGDPVVLEKMAHALHMADKVSGVDRYYGKGLEDAYVTIYNMTEKGAQAALTVMDILGNQFTTDELVGVGSNLYKQALGPEFTKAVTKAGALDRGMLQQVIPTLPRDEKAILVRFLKQAILREDADVDLLRAVPSA